MVFNALLTISCITGILAGFYWIYDHWQPFAPYLVDGNVFWLVIAAAIMNIFPSAALGRSLKTGRFLWHHYFYGFLVLFFAIIYIVFFTSASLLTVFFVNNTSVAVNIGRFFILGGLTLLLDDLPDVNKKLEAGLNRLKNKVHNAAKIVSVLQILTGAVSLYVFAAVCVYLSQNPQWVTAANLMLAGTVFITGLTCFIFVKRGIWRKMGEGKSGSGHGSH